MKNNLKQKFNRLTIWTHWLSAIFIIIIILLSLNLIGYNSTERSTVVWIHIVLGSLIFVFTIIRVYLLFYAKQPNHLKTGSKFNDKLVIWNHYLLYALLAVISITGIMVFIKGNYLEFILSGSIDILKPQNEIPSLKYHVLTVLFLLLLFIMHILGVLKHYIITKENTLKRIS